MVIWTKYFATLFNCIDKNGFGHVIFLQDSSCLGYLSQATYSSPVIWPILESCIELAFMSVFMITIFATRRRSYRFADSRISCSIFAQCLKYFTTFAGLTYMGVAMWYLRTDWSRPSGSEPTYSWISSLIKGTRWIMMSFSLRLSMTRSLSMFVRIWWMTTFFLSSLTAFASMAELVRHRVTIVVALASWPIGFLLFVLALTTWKSVDSGKEISEHLVGMNAFQQTPADISINTPFARSRLLSRMLFLWLTPLLALGYRSPLEQGDLPHLVHCDKAEVAYNSFARAWDKQKKHGSKSNTSLFWTLAMCHWKDLAYNGFFALAKTLTLSCGPLLLNSFVNFARGKGLSKYQGLVLVGVLFLAKVVESLSQRQWYFGSRRVGMHVQSALIGAIYQKVLRLSSIGRQSHAAGEIVNYMAVDAYRIGEFPYWIHFIWTTPLQILFALVILFISVGWASVAGLTVIVITILANSPQAQLQHKYQTELMKAQDERLRETSEVLRNMKILKLQTWEQKFKFLIDGLRKIEYKWLSAVQFRKTFNSLVFWLSPILVSTATFIACYYIGVPLTANNVFTALSTLRIVQDPLRLFPDIIAVIVRVKVSLSRLGNFFQDDELDESAVERSTLQDDDCAVEIEDGSFSWDPLAPKPTLQHIGLRVKHGERVAVCGEVGSGKSSLLLAILGEILKLRGVMKVSGSTAYVSQTAWIQSGTLRDNILFGRPFDKDHYNKTIRACSLEKDIELFPFGDLTEIGERGLNMSGGQKQRIQLARAIYQEADIYLLDDPFSAVDAHTGSNLFQNCIMGALANKTVILVTHQVEFLPAFNLILLMQDGEISEAGRYSDLLKAESAFEELVDAHKEAMGIFNEESDAASLLAVNRDPQNKSILLKKMSSIKSHKQPLRPAEVTEDSGHLIQEEVKETGDTGLKPYLTYLKQSNGFVFFAFGILAHLVFVGGQMASNWWLASSIGNPNMNPGHLIAVYSSIGISTGCILYFRSYFAVLMGLAASRSFFSSLMDSLFHAPMTFFDSTPTGRILSRLSTDLSIVDIDVPFSCMFSVSATLNMLSNLTMTAMVTWQILVLVIPLLYLNRRLQLYYLASARELMRLNGTTKAPIANHFGEAISGAATIRAYKKETQFMKKTLELRDANSTSYFHSIAANEWLIQRLEGLATAVLCSSALLIVLLPAGYIDPGFVGLAISYGLSLNSSQVFSVQNQCVLANQIISVERIKQYLNLPSEAPAVIEKNRPPSTWPREGKVELKNLQVRYRPDTPLVLRGITCTFQAGHKVGVVGRTGSGKSTLIGALFRLVDPVAGTIMIDDLDITAIGLHDLRSRLSIIPQEPTLFRGTVRFNMDPLGQYSDFQIWEALDKCQLGDIMREKFDQLAFPVGDDGENWSVGQRQLFCLGRALLKSSKILVLDEATASIDNATDSILQKIIREEFIKCTVITVAHRIPTVVDSDMVLGLNDGFLAEFDQPMKLLESKTSLFAKLVAEYCSNAQLTIDSAHTSSA